MPAVALVLYIFKTHIRRIITKVQTRINTQYLTHLPQRVSWVSTHFQSSGFCSAMTSTRSTTHLWRSVVRIVLAAIVVLRLAGYLARSFRDEQLRHMMKGSISALDAAGFVSFLDWVSIQHILSTQADSLNRRAHCLVCGAKVQFLTTKRMPIFV
jgi:hypothetical protein